MEVSGGYAYLAVGIDDFSIYDIDPVDSAYKISYIDSLVGHVHGVAVSGGYAYLAMWDWGIKIIKLW